MEYTLALHGPAMQYSADALGYVTHHLGLPSSGALCTLETLFSLHLATENKRIFSSNSLLEAIYLKGHLRHLQKNLLFGPPLPPLSDHKDPCNVEDDTDVTISLFWIFNLFHSPITRRQLTKSSSQLNYIFTVWPHTDIDWIVVSHMMIYFAQRINMNIGVTILINQWFSFSRLVIQFAFVLPAINPHFLGPEQSETSLQYCQYWILP